MKITDFLFLLLLFVLFSCQNPNTSTPKTIPINDSPQSNMPIAEKGITVVNPDGWTEQNMSFHLDYCAQMLASIANEYDPTVFCPCFLEKIQYYYEPIYFKEAYEDQQKWNEECMSKAQIAK